MQIKDYGVGKKQDVTYTAALTEALAEDTGISVYSCNYDYGFYMGQETPIMKFFNPDNPLGIRPTRSMFAGGTFFLDEGVVATHFSFEGIVEDRLEFVPVLKSLLEKLGLTGLSEVGNDVQIGDKKIGSATSFNLNGRTIVAFGIPVTLDFDLAEQMLIVTKHATTLRDRATCITDELGSTPTVEEIHAALLEAMKEYFSTTEVIVTRLPKTIDTKAKELQKNKYTNDEWNLYGRSYKTEG